MARRLLVSVTAFLLAFTIGFFLPVLQQVIAAGVNLGFSYNLSWSAANLLQTVPGLRYSYALPSSASHQLATVPAHRFSYTLTASSNYDIIQLFAHRYAYTLTASSSYSLHTIGARRYAYTLTASSSYSLYTIGAVRRAYRLDLAACYSLYYLRGGSESLITSVCFSSEYRLTAQMSLTLENEGSGYPDGYLEIYQYISGTPRLFTKLYIPRIAENPAVVDIYHGFNYLIQVPESGVTTKGDLFELVEFKIIDSSGSVVPSNVISGNQSYTISATYKVYKPVYNVNLEFYYVVEEGSGFPNNFIRIYRSVGSSRVLYESYYIPEGDAALQLIGNYQYVFSPPTSGYTTEGYSYELMTYVIEDSEGNPVEPGPLTLNQDYTVKVYYRIFKSEVGEGGGGGAPQCECGKMGGRAEDGMFAVTPMLMMLAAAAAVLMRRFPKPKASARALG